MRGDGWGWGEDPDRQGSRQRRDNATTPPPVHGKSPDPQEARLQLCLEGVGTVSTGNLTAVPGAAGSGTGTEGGLED